MLLLETHPYPTNETVKATRSHKPVGAAVDHTVINETACNDAAKAT
jgi:hypothetical protein